MKDKKDTIQFDNITYRVIDDLKKSLNEQSCLSVAADSFSIYAYEALKVSFPVSLDNPQK